MGYSMDEAFEVEGHIYMDFNENKIPNLSRGSMAIELYHRETG